MNNAKIQVGKQASTTICIKCKNYIKKTIMKYELTILGIK